MRVTARGRAMKEILLESIICYLRPMKKILFASVLFLAACSGPDSDVKENQTIAAGEPENTAPAYTPPDNVDAQISALMEAYGAGSVGIGIIRDGELVWTGYYGKQAPGEPVTGQTMFNTASVSKAVTAETALRLASKGVIDLDEPVAKYYVHPDLVDDPRYALLTPRILLSHQAGFKNWPFLYEDGKLAFIDAPGNGEYNYAGIGFRIFAEFLAAKLGKSYPQIVREEIFEPLGMDRATNDHDTARTMGSIVVPVDGDGKFKDDPGFIEGRWSAADDLFVSVEDYATFLISAMNADGLSEAMIAERARVQTDMTGNAIWGCGADAVDPCPAPYGHSIGWFVFGYEGRIVIHHGGNDRSEGAIGYFEPGSKNGGIIFVNSARGVELWPKIADVVDPDQPMPDVFHDLIRQYFSGE